MKKYIRSILRSSALAASGVSMLLRWPLPRFLRLKLMNAYMQSEAERFNLEETVLSFVKKIELKNTAAIVNLTKSAIIKAASPDEKGIILVGFEHKLDELISYSGIEDVVKNYDILFMPTWQPFYSFSLLRAAKVLKSSLVVLPSSEGCYYKALALPRLFRTLPFHASSWVNAELYVPKNKDIDILMVANFSIYKRHNLLFEALRSLPKELKVVLIGRPLENRGAEDILREAAQYGVSDRFQLIEAPANEEVVEHLCRAKLVLGLSGREGSYVSLAEALFADAAVAVFSNAHIGTKNYINPQTGFLLQSDLPLAGQILQCLSVVETLSPRDWAIKNISAQVNHIRLNSLLRYEAKKQSAEWSRDCDAFHIQSFDIAPLAESWSLSVKKDVNDLFAQGLNFKAQSESSLL